MIAEFDIVTILVAREHISPDAEENVIGRRNHLQDVLASLIALCTALIVILVLRYLLRGQLGVHVHEFENFCADLIELGKLDVAQYLDVPIAPVLHFAIVHGLGLAKLILHRANNVLRNLAHLHSLVYVLVLCVSPLRDECVEVSFAINVWQRVAL